MFNLKGNVMNRVLYASDCLDVLNDSSALPDDSIDLIYLDPPFNSNSRYNLPFKGKDKNLRPVEAFNDTWNWTDENSVQFEELESNPVNRPLRISYALLKALSKGLTRVGGAGQA